MPNPLRIAPWPFSAPYIIRALAPASILLSAWIFLGLSIPAKAAPPITWPSVLLAQSAPTPDERAQTRQRAQDAIEQSGAQTDLVQDPLLEAAPIQTRERAIPRKAELENLPKIGCSPSDPKRPMGCGGCGGCGSCAGPAAAASSLSTVGQLLAALAAFLILGLSAYLLYLLWQKRRYPTHRALDAADLLEQARALSPTAIQDALSVEDYNTAIHALFLHALLRIHDAGHPIAGSWTPREITYRLQVGPAIKEPLSALVHFAERARFTHQRSTRDEFERAERAAQSIEAHIAQETL